MPEGTRNNGIKEADDQSAFFAFIYNLPFLANHDYSQKTFVLSPTQKLAKICLF